MPAKLLFIDVFAMTCILEAPIYFALPWLFPDKNCSVGVEIWIGLIPKVLDVVVKFFK